MRKMAGVAIIGTILGLLFCGQFAVMATAVALTKTGTYSVTANPLPTKSEVGAGLLTSYSFTQEKMAFEQRMDVMRAIRHWLEYDHVALAVLIIGLGIVELVAFGI